MKLGVKDRPKLKANEAMAEAVRAKQADQGRIASIQSAEREQRQAESEATRARIREVIATQDPDEVEEVERGPTKLLARDGLLWLVTKGRLRTHLRMAAEKYRSLYALVHGGEGLRSCLAEATGKAVAQVLAHGVLADGTSWRLDAPSVLAERKVKALMDLDDARTEALRRDQALIWLVDEVAGKGSTIRDLAKGDKDAAMALEVEFKVACRLLARHFGMAG